MQVPGSGAEPRGVALRTSTVGMIGASAVFGLLAVFVAQGWLNRQAELRLRSLQQPEKAAPTRTVVVATAPLRFGDQLVQRKLREVAWPDEAVPAGTFASISEALSSGKRTVLASIEPNEPVLKAKVTGPGQKATLSALIQQGMKAVTIRVNDVDGVAGFVLPGDHVDVLMTRQPDKANSSTEVVLQMVKVLAIDQSADAAADKPAVARAVTLEVDTVSAQKLSLAGSIGALSLALRKAGESDLESTRQVTPGDFAGAEAPKPVAPKRFATVTVTRGGKTQDGKSQDYSVASEADARTAGGDGAIKAVADRVLQTWGVR
jgi:pilus assembly protein CpaB